MPYVAGNDIDAHCPSCGIDREHTVLDVQGGIVHKVRCKACAAEHAYQRPRRPRSPKASEAAAPRRKAARKPKAQPEPVKSSWEELVFGRDPAQARPYAIRDSFKADELVTHATFGLGVVRTVHPDGKIDVVFQGATRTLVHGRG